MTARRLLSATLSQLLDQGQRRAIRSRVNGLRHRLMNRLRRYDAGRLNDRLRGMGVAPDDTLLVHANCPPDSGFDGTPLDIVNALVELVGERGNLMMVSIPFRGSAYDYLASGKVFNVRKTMSMMGLVTELFRRREGTRRSLHPTHPVLAFGRDADSLVADHEGCLYPCGSGSPFEKLARANGKILFFDVGFEAITFFHYVEHLLQDRLPFPVYEDRLFSATTLDASGRTHPVRTYAFSRSLVRRADRLRDEMRRQGKIRAARIGNSRLLLVSAADVVACFSAMVAAGNYPYEVRAAQGEGMRAVS